MIEFGKYNKNNIQDKWNYCHNFPLLPLLGVNGRLPLFHICKNIVYFHYTEELINEFLVGYMVTPILRVNKVFKEQVKKCMNKHLLQPYNLIILKI